jgi:transportin-3
MQNWIRFSYPTNDELEENLEFVEILFHSMQTSDFFESSVDAIIEILLAMNSRKTSKLIDLVYMRLMEYHAYYVQSNLSDDGFDAKSFSRLYMEAAEAYLELIMESNRYDGILSCVLQCTAIDDLEISKITFDFWYCFSSRIRSASESFKERFRNIFLSLLDITIKHLRYPSDLDSWTSKERDEFRSFRHEIGDCLKDCCVVLSDSTALQIVLEYIERFAANSTAEKFVWQDIESCLFALRSMGREVSEHESVVMPKIITYLTRLPEHSKIVYAVIMVYSRYAEWTAKHPEYLEFQLKYALKGLTHSETQSASALALKFLGRFCSQVKIPLYASFRT